MQNTERAAPAPALNDAQQKAVTEGDGAVLVLAGAGTGKTRVLVERLCWLIDQCGVDPRRLLALTFTNRAANEMRERLAQRLQMDRVAVWTGTFHSFGLYILRREMDKLGRRKVFTIFDDADQMALLKSIVKDLRARVSPRDAQRWISRLKQDLRTPAAEEDPALPRIWNAYHEALRKADGVDFDDLLALTARLLDEHPELRSKYGERFQYIHVDEYQDTNHAQYWIAKRLSEAHGNLFVVGDEDQSIYSWRGADLNNILDFQRDFTGAKTFRLEQNYRSTEAILAVANAVVANNTERLGKNLWTRAGTGPPVRFYHADDSTTEADWVAAEIERGDAPLAETAVLFRTNAQSRLVEEALRRCGIPYTVVGGVHFYGRKEVKDLLAYLRLLVNPDDDLSLRRIVNVPPRGIGAATLERVGQYAAERGMPMLAVLRDIEHDQTFGTAARRAIAGFVELIDNLTAEARQATPGALVTRVIQAAGYREFVQRSDEKESKDRLEIVQEFVNACNEYEARNGGRLAEFLQELSLMTDTDKLDPAAPVVKLLTCHSAKGLEFHTVYLIGLEEGLLPHAMAMESGREIEEERRLCYVAMTRARHALTLTAARVRTVYGSPRDSELSRFLAEIPPERLSPVEPRKRQTAAPPPPARAETQQLKMGTRVRHAKFGAGTVMYVAGSGSKMRVRVRFQTGRTRELMVSHAPMEILDAPKRGT